MKENPQNANKLAESLRMDYKTIRHHLEILQKDQLTTSVGEGYAITYFLSNEVDTNYALFEMTHISQNPRVKLAASLHMML